MLYHNTAQGPRALPKLLCCHMHFLDPYISMRVFVDRCESSPVVQFLLNCPQGLLVEHFSSAPDVTPFTLDQQNTKEKPKFYVKEWVITCRKTTL